MKLTVGEEAPDFTLPDQEGRPHTLSSYKGDWVLLYFYPKDDTPGCTAEACGVRDNYDAFGDAGVTVLGVSVDSVKSHAKFVQKYALPFTLLADEKKEVVEMYGVWGEKKLMGHDYQGTSRVSFLIDPKGNIAKVYEQVKPAAHAEQVLADMDKLKE
jgi:peroxiredoxin Q/BCP